MGKFEVLYEEYFPRIYSFLYKLCKDECLAEELTQETFYQAFVSFHRFKGKSSIFTWLAAIGKHTYYRYLRKNRLGFESISMDLVTDTFCAGHEDDPEEAFQKKSVAETVEKTIGRIPQKYRDVVILRIYAEMPFSEVASTLNISESSAKVIFFRAKKMLLEEMNDVLEL